MYVRFNVFKTTNTRIFWFRGVMPCSLVELYRISIKHVPSNRAVNGSVSYLYLRFNNFSTISAFDFKPDRQYRYNVTQRRVRVAIVEVKKQ